MLRLCLIMLPTLLAAAGSSIPVMVLPLERAAPTGAAPVFGRQAPGASFEITIGSVDTIGGTTYDWLTSGSILRMLVDSRRYGIHAVWMYSASTSGTDFPDRCMRYNFYDSGLDWWNWIDPDFMQSGVNVFAQRTGYGSVDRDPDGVAVVSGHISSGSDLVPILARDADVGCGIFDYYDSAGAVCQWPAMAVDGDGVIHVFAMTAAYDLMYSHVAGDNWSEWLADFPSPGFPTHNLAASKISNKVCATWTTAFNTLGQESGYVRESPDGGETWYDPALLEFPPAFSGDTLPTFYITGLFPFYDADDRLNIVADVSPCVNDTHFILPVEMWHYCPDNNPHWNRIHRAGCDPENLQASPGYNALYACRPSMGEDDYGNLFVAWEQFDSANVEPATSRLRADIWASGSTDGGLTWSTASRLTTSDTVSCRFPSIGDRLWPGDSLAVRYEIDLCAGFFVQSEGPGTYNPVVVQKVPADSIMQRGSYLGRLKTPNGGEFLSTGDTCVINWAVTPKDFDHGVLSLSTDGGNTFPTVINASIPPAETMESWYPVPQLSCSLCRMKFEAKDSLGTTLVSDESYRNFRIDSVFVGVSDNPPAAVRLLGASPSPFGRATEIRYELGRAGPATLTVRDVSGRTVRGLASGSQPAGFHSVAWDGKDDRGHALPAGVYFCTLSAESQRFSRKVVLTE